MVFGNKGETSGTGVAFTRDPSTGENMFYGEFLMNAQGEDVVAGVRHPRPLDEMRAVMPEVLDQLYDIRRILEGHYRDMQDLEFTIEDGKLFMLQTRNGKRTAAAALQVAVDMVAEGMITKEEAVAAHRSRRSSTSSCTRCSTPRPRTMVLTTGLNASPGAAVGQVVFDADTAEVRGLGRRPGHPRAVGDQPRRHPRADQGAGCHHQPRRHDVARGRRRPGHGQALHRGRQPTCRSTRRPGTFSVGDVTVNERRLDHHGRHHRAR